MKTAVLPLLLLCAAVLPAHTDSLLDRAAAAEKSGDLEASASTLAQWLAANPGAATAADVFASYLRVEQDFPRLLQTGTAFLKSSHGVSGAAPQFERIARLLDLAGRIEEARDAYLAAHQEGAGDAALVEAFLLSLRMNDADAMTAALQQLKGGSAGVQILLQALGDLERGDRAAARTALVGLSEQSGNPDLALKSLWVLYQSAQRAGDAVAQSDARARLVRRFGSSPESALAGSASSGKAPRQVVLPAPVPDVLLPAPLPAGAPAPTSSPPVAPSAAPSAQPPAAAADRGTVTPAPTPSSPMPSPATPVAVAAPAPASPLAADSPVSVTAPVAPLKFSVQAGSFGVKENADDLLSELTRRGFAATEVQDTLQGKDRWRVFAGSGLDRDAAESVRGKLSGAGFLGLLVADR
ncbi:MAG TPA: SPOR domain-containing protein [Spirochaetia bacterium]|nr:SPOR domain-containing protein [Spirochaetia bacterium]